MLKTHYKSSSHTINNELIKILFHRNLYLTLLIYNLILTETVTILSIIIVQSFLSSD